MKKIITIPVLIAFCILLFTSCGKKITASFSSNNHHGHYVKHKMHDKVSQNEAAAACHVDTVAQDTATPASEQEVVEARDAKDTKVSKADLKQKVTALRDNIKTIDRTKLTDKQEKLVNKLDKKLERIEKKADKNADGGLMRAGIILAIAGLALIVLGILVHGVFYFLGVLFLLVGIILILVDLIS